MKGFYQRCLSTAEILEANDTVTRVMTLYKHTVEGEKPAGDYTPTGAAGI